MISTIYKAKIERKWGYGNHHHSNHQTTVHHPPAIQRPQQAANTTSLPQLAPFTPLHEATMRAAKLGITTEEWQRRDAIVRRKFAENSTWKFMDTFYPSVKAIYEERGRCWFLGASNSYKDIDHDVWPSDDNVLIFSGRPCKGGEDFICNLKLLSKVEPT